MSVGSQGERKQAVEDAVNEVTLITGQKPVITKSKKAIANFKLREGENVGVKITLRGPRMYDFLMRLVRTALPRVRDFRGVAPRAFDGRGNYTLGVNDQSIFPEIELDKNLYSKPCWIPGTRRFQGQKQAKFREAFHNSGFVFSPFQKFGWIFWPVRLFQLDF